MKPAPLLLWLALAAGSAGAEESAPGTPDPATHADSSERLRAIMDGINRSLDDDTDTGAIPGAIDAAQMAQLLEAVEELLYHAELMTPESSPRQLGTSEIVTFRALASQLYTEALNIRTLAGTKPASTYEFNQINASFDRLYETCTACHDLFRDR